MLKRIIVCLDVRDGRTTKGVKFAGNKDIGDPVEMANRYYYQGVDELVFYDITASVERRAFFHQTVRQVAQHIFIPLSVGGGISSVADMYQALESGAEKVSVNSAAVSNAQLITDGAKQFGSQCIVLGVDSKQDATMPSGYRVYVHGGRTATERDLLQWAQEAETRGAGEVVLNSIDADGTGDGYDITSTRLLSDALNIPVVASGGGGTVHHLAQVLSDGRADAALVASMVHYGTHTVSDIKAGLSSMGIRVRPVL